MKDDVYFEDDEPLEETSENEVISLLKRMQQQLTFLESKVDMLVSQSQERKFEKKHSHGQHFPRRSDSQAPRPFERTERYGRGGDRDRNSRDRDSAPGHYFERRKTEKKRAPGARKKPFFSHRKDRD